MQTECSILGLLQLKFHQHPPVLRLLSCLSLLLLFTLLPSFVNCAERAHHAPGDLGGRASQQQHGSQDSSMGFQGIVAVEPALHERTELLFEVVGRIQLGVNLQLLQKASKVRLDFLSCAWPLHGAQCKAAEAAVLTTKLSAAISTKAPKRSCPYTCDPGHAPGTKSSLSPHCPQSRSPAACLRMHSNCDNSHAHHEQKTPQDTRKGRRKEREIQVMESFDNCWGLERLGRRLARA